MSYDKSPIRLERCDGILSVPVCNIFKEVLLEGELCYQADVNNLREETDKEGEREGSSQGGVICTEQ